MAISLGLLFTGPLKFGTFIFSTFTVKLGCEGPDLDKGQKGFSSLAPIHEQVEAMGVQPIGRRCIQRGAGLRPESARFCAASPETKSFAEASIRRPRVPRRFAPCVNSHGAMIRMPRWAED